MEGGREGGRNKKGVSEGGGGEKTIGQNAKTLDDTSANKGHTTLSGGHTRV